MQGSFVALVDDDIELMEMQDMTGIIEDLYHGCFGISPALVLAKYHQSEFGTEVLWVEIGKVGKSHYLVFAVFYDQPHLPIDIDIITGMNDVVAE